jgi:hypothetical protein
MAKTSFDALKLDYEQTLATYRQLVEVRFKLLAFVPTISGAGIALLTASRIEDSAKAGLAAAGVVVTFAIVLYDQRNTQFHNGAIGRAQRLETALGFPAVGGDVERGLFAARREHPPRHLFGVPIRHDLALALVYSCVFGGWTALLADALWDTNPVTTVAALAVGLLLLVQLLWHDGAFAPLHARAAHGRLADDLFVVRDGLATRITRDALLAAFAEAADLGTPTPTAYDCRGHRVYMTTSFESRWHGRDIWRRNVPRELAARPFRPRDVSALRDALILARSRETRPSSAQASLADLVAECERSPS